MDLQYPPIGISGRKRAGKNTLADRIADVALNAGIVPRIVAFADPLRRALLALDPIIDPAGEDYPPAAGRLSDLFSVGFTWETLKDHPDLGPEVRRLLQRFGTDSIRAIDPEFWTRAAKADILAHPDKMTILPDVRFANEADVVKDLGGWHFHVERRSVADPADTHVSETNIDLLAARADYIIDNDAGVGYLRDYTLHEFPLTFTSTTD